MNWSNVALNAGWGNILWVFQKAPDDGKHVTPQLELVVTKKSNHTTLKRH